MFSRFFLHVTRQRLWGSERWRCCGSGSAGGGGKEGPRCGVGLMRGKMKQDRRAEDRHRKEPLSLCTCECVCVRTHVCARSCVCVCAGVRSTRPGGRVEERGVGQKRDNRLSLSCANVWVCVRARSRVCMLYVGGRDACIHACVGRCSMQCVFYNGCIQEPPTPLGPWIAVHSSRLGL